MRVFFLVLALPGERCSTVLRLASIDESESESEPSTSTSSTSTCRWLGTIAPGALLHKSYLLWANSSSKCY